MSEVQLDTRPAGLVAIGRRIRELAAQHPDKAGIVVVSPTGDEDVISWSDFEARTNQVARLLASRGARPGSFVIVGLGNSAEHYYASFGAWKVGACILPLSPRLSEREREALIGLAEPSVVVADWGEDAARSVLSTADLASAAPLSSEPLDDVVAEPGKAIGSGGSTGRPKIILDPSPFGYSGDSTAPELGMRTGQVQLVAAGLFHNAPLGWSTRGLLADHTLIVMSKFDADRAVQLIHRHRVQFMAIAPIIMQRLLRAEGAGPEMFASVESIMHTGAPCPPWVKRGWIELIGAENVHEGFGASENVGATNIRGDEWLEHPGSVGRPPATGPFACEVKILDDDGGEVPAGTVGEIFMKPQEPGERFRYIGSAPPKATPEGFVSVGDMGRLDEDGWLFLADRRLDMIVTGGTNVYPAEIEAVLTEHPGIADAAVIGVPDEDWGLRVHAILLATDIDSPPDVDDLHAFGRNALVSYKVPKSYEFLREFPRDEAGKIRRNRLAQEREQAWSPGMLRAPGGSRG